MCMQVNQATLHSAAWGMGGCWECSEEDRKWGHKGRGPRPTEHTSKSRRSAIAAGAEVPMKAAAASITAPLASRVPRPSSRLAAWQATVRGLGAGACCSCTGAPLRLYMRAMVGLLRLQTLSFLWTALATKSHD